MRKTYYSLIICFYINVFFAQTVQDVIGDWEFYSLEVKESEAKPQEAKAKLTPLMNSMKIKLNSDKSYESSLLGITETGRWDIKDKNIEFITNDGKMYGYPITAYEKNKLTLDHTKIYLILSRVGAGLPSAQMAATPHEKSNYQVITPNIITKKWFLKQRPAPANLTEKQKEDFGEMLSGSYIEFSPNNKCILQLGSKKENGQWTLNNTKTGVKTTFKNIPAQWMFIKVSASDLIIEDASSHEQWVFSSIE
ncbi:hypothetical protein [Flavobacterium sp. NRK1]|uniref:hypothetical protein n=1 Tax=Flavobacterium sp. NRK1 TaxID=2954929 RepID=UPI0020923DC3|nr:hypothetical protein [Flavobacterium sp. NRK1]MCO6149533.1 hypothetical protein [Flavobacterium sp. NRK1]